MVVIPPGQQPTEWTRPADRLSAEYAGYDVSIEVPAPDVGDNPMVERPPVDDVTTTTRTTCWWSPSAARTRQEPPHDRTHDARRHPARRHHPGPRHGHLVPG